MSINPDQIGWIGTAFFFAGGLLIVRKKRLGFICNLMGNLTFVCMGWLADLYSIVVVSIGFLVLNVYGIIKWRRKQ